MMQGITYSYDRQPTGSYDFKWYCCVTKRTNGEFNWSWCNFPSEEAAQRFCDENQGRDLPYPGQRK
jgi:hypothetical protein